jgi:signal transduction histidine kinase
LQARYFWQARGSAPIGVPVGTACARSGGMHLRAGRKAHSNRSAPSANAAHPIGALQHAHAVILLRWVLIVATSYLVLFSRPLSEVTPAVALFIAGYLASNVIVTEMLPRLQSPGILDWILIVVDTVALSVALILTNTTSNDLFILYFAVLFLSALSERIGLVVGAAFLVTVAHLYTLSHFVELAVLLQPAYMLRIPFLFVVALFFGHLVHHARVRERAFEDGRSRDLRLDLLSAVSHDLKNPLGVIESLSELMLDGSAGPLNEQQADLARRIQSSTRQVLVLSQNLIDAERVDAGRLVLQRRVASLATVVDDALVVAASASAIKGIALQVSIEPGMPAICIDTVQMERVVANLLSNAIKFTPAGGRVRLALRRQRDALIMTVSDDGPGILPEELPRLSERHFRGARSRGVEGSGLGLFIVRAVVEAHGGTLRIASGIGRGTVVTVILQLGDASAAVAEDAVVGVASDLMPVAPAAHVG